MVWGQDRKNPALSCVLSIALPGVGQYYNGTDAEVIKGIFQDGGFIGGAVIAEAEGVNSFTGGSNGLFTKPGGVSAAGVLGIGLAFGSWVWSFVDAPLSSDQINKDLLQEKPLPIGMNPGTHYGAEGRKSPFLSLLMSAVVPGLGQYYNGTENEVIKGVIQDAGILGSFGLNSSSYNDRGLDYLEVLTIGGCYLWSVIDAPLSSADINGELAYQMRSSNNFNMHLTLLNDSPQHMFPGAEMSLKF